MIISHDRVRLLPRIKHKVTEWINYKNMIQLIELYNKIIKKNCIVHFRLFLIISVLLFVSINDGISQIPARLIVEAIEYPGRDPYMWDGLYAASDGKVYTCLITERVSAHFYLYDPVKRENRMVADMADFLGERGKGIRTSGKLHNKPVEDDDGNIYFVTMCNGSGPPTFDFTSWLGGHWLKYDPKADKLEDMGLVDQGIGCYPLTIDKKRGYLFAIGFTGYFYRFDLKNRVTKNLGRVSDWDICRDIFCDDEGNVFMSFPTARVLMYDAQKEKVYETSLRIPYDPTIFPTQLKNPMIDRTNIWRSVEWDPVDKVAYGVTCGSGSILFRFDPHKGTYGEIVPLSKICDTRFLQGDPKNIPYSTLAFAIDYRNKKIFFAPSARSFDIQGYVETFGSAEGHHLIMYDLKRNERIDLGEMRTSDGRKVFGSEGASVAPDGTVYICAQVEVRDPKKATSMIGNIPVALHLVVYKP
jgi:hypothetical protein